MIQQPASSSYQQVLFSHVSRHLFSALLSHWSSSPTLASSFSTCSPSKAWTFTEIMQMLCKCSKIWHCSHEKPWKQAEHPPKFITVHSVRPAKSTCGHNRASRRCCRAVISESRLWITATWWDFRGRCRYLIFMHELITNVYQWELLTFFVNSGWPWKKYGVFFACKWLNWFIGFNSCITSAWLVTLKGHLKISGSWRFEICSWCSKSTFRVPVWKSSAM